MEIIDTCPQCARALTNGATSCRLVQDACGHKKCRLCILNDENSCKQCLEGKQLTGATQSTEIDVHPTVITYQKKSPITEPISDVPNASKPSKHIIFDNVKQEFTCTICLRSFTTKSQIRYHDYCGGDKKPFNCDVCKKGFIVKSHFTTHLLAHQNLKPFKCMECGKTFYERSKLNRHKLSHTATRPHMCQMCGKTFKIKENLRTHSLIHRTDKPYDCPECDLKFSHSSNLKKHLTVHMSDKAHMCDQCGKRFKLKWALTLHRRGHSKTRPNQCATCSKTFVHQKDLARHELIHAATKTFRCGICDTSFKRKDNLSRHTRNAHPGRKPQVLKCGDNPNAIKVITSHHEPSETEAKNDVNHETSRQQVNGPLKLALKTPTFKNNYNIHRNYVQPKETKPVNIYEKILNPRMPATLISAGPANGVQEEQQQDDDAGIMQCQWTLGPMNAPLHYESSFKENAVIKNIKFKLPAKYTNLNSRDSSRSSATSVLNAILNVGDEDVSDAKSIQQATTSVIVNSPTNLNSMQDVHWRKRNAQFIAAND